MLFKYFLYSVFLLFPVIITSSPNLLNKQAPHFIAQAVFPNGLEQSFDLKKYLGKKIVLYFYPMDNTPGCTCQAKNFRDNITKLEEHEIIVVGISCDSINSHKNFQKKYALPYILVSDSRKSRGIAKMYGSDSFFINKRKTFLIDENGIIFKKFDKINIEKQVDDIVNAFNNH
jgi:peroxiredoxin Q/BCP